MDLFLRVESVDLHGNVSVYIYGRHNSEIDKNFTVKRGIVYCNDIAGDLIIVHIVNQKGAPPFRLQASNGGTHPINWSTLSDFQAVVHVPEPLRRK